MKQLIIRLKSWLKAQDEFLITQFNERVTLEDCKKLEQTLSVKLPEDFIELYCIHNGQINQEEGIFKGYSLLPIKNIISNWKIQKRLVNDPYMQSLLGDSVDEWYNLKWIPFASFGNGDLICIDLQETNNYGRIIEFFHEDAYRPVLSNSITNWIKEFVDELEENKYYYSSSYSAVEKNM